MKSKVIITIAILSLIMLGSLGCGNSNGGDTDIQPPTNTSNNTEPEDEPSQEEINQQIKEEAVRADFVKLNVTETEAQQYIGEDYFIEGEVIAVDNSNTILPEFFVTTEEGDGYGVYSVINLFQADIKEGDKVRVYGGFVGFSDYGMPQISGNVIEML